MDARGVFSLDEDFKRAFDRALDRCRGLVMGKMGAFRLALLALLCRGNLLVEDLPGVGKTTLAHLLARVLGRRLTRIQFTNDLLPSDVLGAVVLDQRSGEFVFRKGPIFGELILADELNRAAPKSQSALLQCMEEGRVTVEGEDHELDEGFCVVATQNPSDHVGTFALPESQVDRFFMGMSLGLPSREDERGMIRSGDGRAAVDEVGEIVTRERQREFAERLPDVGASDALLDYVLDLMARLRGDGGRQGHVSPRAGRDLVRAARGLALLEGRAFAVPEDVKAAAPAVFAHRLGFGRGVAHGRALVERALGEVAVP